MNNETLMYLKTFDEWDLSQPEYDAIKAIIDENEKLRQALEIYSDDTNWIGDEYEDTWAQVMEHGWKKAREALKGGNA